MGINNYQVHVIDPETGEGIDLVTARRLINLRYTRKLNDVGVFQFTVLASDRFYQFRNLLDAIIEVYRDNQDGFGLTLEDTYFLRGYEVFQDNETDYLIVTGEHVHRMLKFTQILVDDDPLAAGGYSTKAGVGDTVMYGFVTDQMIAPATNTARTRAYISNNINNLEGQPVSIQVDKGTVLEVLQALTVKSTMDFRITRAIGATFVFTVLRIGNDRTVTANSPSGPFTIFSPERRTLKNPRYTVQRAEEITVAWLALQGLEDNRFFTPVNSLNLLDSPFNRQEIVSDARQLENSSPLDALLTEGQAVLRENQPIIQFEFDIDTTAAGAIYNNDWFLGDKVTAQYGAIIEDLRIIEVEVTASQGSESVTPKLQRLFS